ncbi:MAG: protease family protein [Actinomycetota bacterium]|nr:protease family protein [Actinomycetota bacterium]
MTLGSDLRPDAARTLPVSGGRALVVFFVLAYALSWAWVIPLAVSQQVVDRGQGWPTHYPALLGPTVAAFLVVAATSGRLGMAELLRRMVLWRVGWRWWLVAFSPAAFGGIAFLGSWVSGLSLPRAADFGLFSGVPTTGLPVVFLLVILGALGEETGWRGFALPRLQHRFSPLVASLILAALWALWHLPLFFVIATYRGMGIAQYDGFVLGLSCGAIVLTWVYNRSGGSILLVAVWHGVFNLVSGTQAATDVIAAVVSTLIMAQALLLVGLDRRARRRVQPSPLGAPPSSARQRR